MSGNQPQKESSPFPETQRRRTPSNSSFTSQAPPSRVTLLSAMEYNFLLSQQQQGHDRGHGSSEAPGASLFPTAFEGASLSELLDMAMIDDDNNDDMRTVQEEETPPFNSSRRGTGGGPSAQ
mmetsp:Transcript_13901/g.30375  ORF Transcript_13901/g.30375 Transcript_13901/m.30375 type:complete len:122 (+) Transcript_13901:58-423(+)